jgi:hypothetical protein
MIIDLLLTVTSRQVKFSIETFSDTADLNLKLLISTMPITKKAITK